MDIEDYIFDNKEHTAKSAIVLKGQNYDGKIEISRTTNTTLVFRKVWTITQRRGITVKCTGLFITVSVLLTFVKSRVLSVYESRNDSENYNKAGKDLRRVS